MRVMIFADDPLAIAALAMALEQRERCDVVAQVSTEADILEATGFYQVDVIVWDLGWSFGQDGSGSDQLPDLDDEFPPAIFLFPDLDEAQGILARARPTTGRGYLRRDVDAEALESAMLAVAAGLIVIDPDLAGTISQPPALGRMDLPELLTPRELEVLQLLAEGLPNKTIAHTLGISDHTVKFHVNAIMGKLGAQSRTEAVVQATRQGLIML